MLTPASYSPNRLESVIYPHVKLSVLKKIFPKIPNYAFNHLQTDVFYPCIIQLSWTYGCVFLSWAAHRPTIYMKAKRDCFEGLTVAQLQVLT